MTHKENFYHTSSSIINLLVNVEVGVYELAETVRVTGGVLVWTGIPVWAGNILSQTSKGAPLG